MYKESNLERIKILTNEVETLKEEKDVVDGKLARLLKSSKDLENIIEIQRSKKVKEGVGYNVVPPPTANLYLPPRKIYHGLVYQNLWMTQRKVQRETNRSQNHSYKSSTYRSAGHRPTGAHMRPPLRSFGSRPHGDSMRPSFRPAGHRPHGSSMNPKRPTMNGARPYKTFFQTPLYETKPFLKSSAVKNSFRAPWVPTVNSNMIIPEADSSHKLPDEIDEKL
nr:hypothetical protein [Tanacetum cinerariifolium]